MYVCMYVCMFDCCFEQAKSRVVAGEEEEEEVEQGMRTLCMCACVIVFSLPYFSSQLVCKYIIAGITALERRIYSRYM